MNRGKDVIYHGDCLEMLPKLAASSIDLIVTSPPYADRRKNTYGGVARELSAVTPVDTRLRSPIAMRELRNDEPRRCSLPRYNCGARFDD